MNAAPEPVESGVEHVDVAIVGAGLSGIGAACHLELAARDGMRPRSYVLLEAREATGGTWDLFRYPGVRSDSDMFTLGYRFRPWAGEVMLADGEAILSYVRETAEEHDVLRHVRLGHRVERAEWSSTERRWTLTVQHDQAVRTFTADVLWSCSGYYDYESGYTPDLPGVEEYEGRLVHPQHWPDDLDVDGSQVVVIGSGATAVTLVPALADLGAQVTMLQRSPTYILSAPRHDPLAAWLMGRVPTKVAHGVNRWRSALQQSALYGLSKARPDLVRGLIRRLTVKSLPEGYDVDTHFNPRYDPWDQRLCLVPDGDLFAAIRAGRAEVVTDTIETFTAKGVRLTSGEELVADVVVTATGLNLLAFGGMEFVVDGEPVVLADTMAYKAMMLSGVPNFCFTIGYTNASWTLKADLVSEHLLRVLRELDRTGRRVFTPQRQDGVEERPLMDFQAGYVLRAVDALPRSGDRSPWRLKQNYLLDALRLRLGPVTDDALRLE